jgi:GAF domain-containing protein
LEERVEARTRGLELVATALERLNILDFNQFLLQLVNQVQSHFNYYHVQVHLVDDMRKNLIMTAGAGAVGEQIKAQGFQTPLNDSFNVLARAVRQHAAINIDNVQQLAGWSPDPLLPDTCSLLVVPIILDGRVVGIMEVQED